MQIVNLDILRSPYNWITVVLMVGFGLLFVGLLSPEDNS